MQQQFKTDRTNFPALCLMPSVVFYESKKPNVPILKRVIQLAKEALNYLEKTPSDSIKVTHCVPYSSISLLLQFLFRSSTNIYDALIILDSLQCPRAYQAVDHVSTEVTYTTRKKPSEIEQNQKLLSIVDYDPARIFFEELRVREVIGLFDNDIQSILDEFHQSS